MMGPERVPNEDEDFALLATLGLAHFTAQALEYQLVTLFAASSLCKGKRFNLAPLRELMDTRFQQTLGRLVTEATGNLELPRDVADLLRDALVERNWLAHRFYREFAGAGLDTGLRRVALNRLQKARVLFEESTNALSEMVYARLETAGIPRADAERGAREALEAYVNEY